MLRRHGGNAPLAKLSFKFIPAAGPLRIGARTAIDLAETVMKILLLLLAAATSWAADELTVYELLAPATHSFDIVYDVTATREGSPYFFNPIRQGSVASKERVIDRATGKTLEWEVVDGRAAKSSGWGPSQAENDARFLRVKLLAPVAHGGGTRIRIYKTYTDPPSYYEKDNGFVFDGRWASSATSWSCPRATNWWARPRRPSCPPIPAGAFA